MSCIIRTLSIVAGILSILTIFYYEPKHWSRNYRIKWIYNTSNDIHHFMTDYLISLEYPVVITDSPLVQHEVMQWTFKSLAINLQYLSCKYSSVPIFQYHAIDQPLDSVPEFTVKKSYQSVMISAQEFFSEIQQIHRSLNKYFYASGGVELLNLPLSFESLSNITFPPNKGSGQVNYWFGSTNVTAYTHYDTSHNLHVVIKGRKRFLLSPPSHHPALFPCLHSLYRQTQVETLEPQIILDIFPGEVLYLPPYWFHSVISVEPSISLNIWSDSRDFLLMEKILTSPIPFQIEWGRNKLMQAGKYFIDSFIEKLTLPKTFIESHVLSRYKLLLANLTSEQEFELMKVVKEYCDIKIDSEIVMEINKRVHETSFLFLEMSSRAILEINFGNYVEHILSTILRDNIIQLPFFLKKCFINHNY